VPALFEVVNDDDEDISVRAAVARALMKIGGRRVKAAKHALTSIDNQATIDAMRTLYRSRSPV
jgi:HEAT repeat protein